jgi:uncharacterized membrane protein YgaE (UPF0421/DUF939 family)
MSTDYRRTAKRYRHLSTAFSVLAGLTTGLGFAVLFTNLWPGIFILTAASVLVLTSLCIGSEARVFARLGASQSRMTAWNRRA